MLKLCSKHSKPFPCGKCRIENAQKPAQAPPIAVMVHTTEQLLAHVELTTKQKEAQRGRERRKQKREQLAAIKLALRTPFAELKRLAEEKAQTALDNINRGMSMTGAPSGKGRLVTGGYDSAKIDFIDAQHYPGWDGEKSTFTPRNKPEGKGSDEAPASEFYVKPGTDIEWGQALQDLSYSLFVKVEPNGDHDGFFICRLCHAGCISERTCKDHLEKVHGEEPDPRFGNVVARKVKEYGKRRRLFAA